MEIFDITRTVQDAPVYPGSPALRIESLSDIARGNSYTETYISADSHAGTHADACTHFIGGSPLSIDKMPLSHYIGPCRVVSVPYDALIRPVDLAGRIAGVERLVLHGGGKAYLTDEAAAYIVEAGIRTLVIDAWSVGPLHNEMSAHLILLGAQVAIIENVTLDHIPDGDYFLSAAPVKYGGLDGAPVRAVLLRF